jgi:hypothetical protein
MARTAIYLVLVSENPIINVPDEPDFKLGLGILHQYAVAGCDTHLWEYCYMELFFRVKRDAGDCQENGIKERSSTCFGLNTAGVTSSCINIVLHHVTMLDLLSY